CAGFQPLNIRPQSPICCVDPLRSPTIVGVDAGSTMLKLAQIRVDAVGLTDRISLERRYLPDSELLTRRFDAIVSNSLLHHLVDPLVLWQTALACGHPGAPVAIMDLVRPPDEATVNDLVTKYASDAPAVLRSDFRNSLLAAYQVEEVTAQLKSVNLYGFTVERVTDRHIMVTGRCPTVSS
ncbi:MAG: class I SAM-dependent methyltransferase, partial [Candidatus Dormibacteraceae bacterium]